MRYRQADDGIDDSNPATACPPWCSPATRRSPRCARIRKDGGAAQSPIDAHNLAKVFKRTGAGLGLPPIVFHELRAIFTTRNLDADVPSNQVADMIGALAMVETYRRRHIDNQRAAHKAAWG